MKISPEVLTVLDRCEVRGQALTLPPVQLDRPTYTAVDKVLKAAGGKWNRSAKAHLFPADCAEIIETMILTGEVTDTKKEFDAFYTPPEIAAMVIERAGIEPRMTVLEPSAGSGALADPARAAGGIVTAYDVRELDGSEVRDFLTVIPTPFDRVVMNPPFSRQQDMTHVTHGLRFVRPGGRLVAIMSPSFLFRESRAASEFRALLDTVKHEVEHLPDGSFRSSGTMVNTVILTVAVAS